MQRWYQNSHSGLGLGRIFRNTPDVYMSDPDLSVFYHGNCHRQHDLVPVYCTPSASVRFQLCVVVILIYSDQIYILIWQPAIRWLQESV